MADSDFVVIPGMGSRRARGRAEIVDAAARVFRRRGYGAATVEDVANELGILKGSLYHYIKSKQELLYDVVVGPLREANRAIDQVLKEGGAVDDLIRKAIIAHIEVIHDQYPRLSIALLEQLELPAEQLEEIRTLHRAYHEKWIDLIREGAESGLLRAELDAGLTALAILGMLNWATQWYRQDGRAAPGEIGVVFASVALDGIRVHQSR